MMYKVQFDKAELVDGRFLVEVTNFAAKMTRHVEASTLDSLIRQVRALAVTDYQHHCAAWVQVPKGARKPAGFDRAVKVLERIEI